MSYHWTEVARTFERELERMSIQALEAGHAEDAVAYVSERIYETLKAHIAEKTKYMPSPPERGHRAIFMNLPSGRCEIKMDKGLHGLRWIYMKQAQAGWYSEGEPVVQEHNVMDLEDHMEDRQKHRQELFEAITFMNDIKDL